MRECVNLIQYIWHQYFCTGAFYLEAKMVREFKLINEKGQEFSLMDIYNHTLLTEPSGLGYTYITEYQQLGDTFIRI